ncbi:intradiol ring-cleavage dioxygenase [Hyphomicrobium sp.]|jgi:protocatechuate 3,4-dioxygenase beta subunit|uniref:intradiol ring-cleavage dioxygenase n=1 Tax=Hyphomicrobium sp. TaxID=82 RepID=UPI002BA1F5FA|nr:intradiol ring-cleavage dioxygenase [Hyphomicrobium sp.]HVZ05710.1 intradiol ring-cleavage dioxygenase [Hyphomicrobium sp.]
MTKFLSRRQALGSVLAAPAAALSKTARAADATPAAADQPPGQCRLFPQAIEGPFYFDPKLMRSDISEGRPGAPLKLQLRIIESGSCTPISNARVDVWHADAGGIYSGYANQGRDREISTKGQSFLRGTQMTDSDGRVAFTSIYPGWYPGRTPHIHVKVFLNEKSLVTGQLYFPDEFSARIYTTRDPYKQRSSADTTNANDGIYRDGEREGGGTVLAMSEDGDMIVAGLLISVDKSGEAAAKANRGFFRRLFGI